MGAVVGDTSYPLARELSVEADHSGHRRRQHRHDHQQYLQEARMMSVWWRQAFHVMLMKHSNIFFNMFVNAKNVRSGACTYDFQVHCGVITLL